MTEPPAPSGKLYSAVTKYCRHVPVGVFGAGPAELVYGLRTRGGTRRGRASEAQRGGATRLGLRSIIRLEAADAASQRSTHPIRFLTRKRASNYFLNTHRSSRSDGRKCQAAEVRAPAGQKTRYGHHLAAAVTAETAEQ